MPNYFEIFDDLPPGFVLDKPPFDASKPFEVADKPAFDPSKPYQAANYFDRFDPPPGFVLDQPSVGEDVAKSVGGGLVGTAAGTAKLVPTISSIAHNAANKYLFDPVFGAISGPPKPTTPEQQPFDVNKSTIEAINSVASPYDYQPKTGLGGLARTGTEFAALMAGGEGSALSKALSQVVAPTLATEAAGALTQGTAAEPWARGAAALLSGAGAAKIANSVAERAALKAATPALDALKSDTSAGYDALTSRNVATPLAADTLDNVANDIRDTLNRTGKRPVNARSIHDAVEELRTPATAGAPDVADLVASRASIKDLLGSPDTNKAGAVVALQKIDEAIEAAHPGTMQTLRDLDKNWGAIKANEALDKRTAIAELRAAGADSGLNAGNKIRQQVTNYLASNESKYLSTANRAELEKITRGTWTQNGMRLFSNLMGGGGGLGSTVLGLGGAIGGEYTGHPELALLPVGGIGLRMATNRSVAKQAARAAQNIRARSPMGQLSPPAIPATTNPAI